MQWLRYGGGGGHHAAHLYEDGAQMCPTQHGHHSYGKEPTPAPAPTPVDVNAHGLPFGRVCDLCLRQWHRRVA